MAIAYSYPLNEDIESSDELIGTVRKVVNGQLRTLTRNFLLSDLATYFTANIAGVQIVSGNGMDFSTISGSGIVTLGTPSSVTLSSTNSLTTTSHTHVFAPGGLVSQYITGAGTLVTFPIIPTVSPSALTKTDDVNVTLTLGGTPATSLLQSVSLTLGWVGTLADVRIASASTWNAKQAALSGTGFVKSTAGVISYDTSTYEPALGNPTVSGYILSSNTSGDRSWIEMTGGGGGDMLKSVYDINDDGVVDKAQSMITMGRNNTGTILVKGTVVYILGATGQLPNFARAQANIEATSAGTFGVINADIPINGNGEATTIGLIEPIDTRTAANGNPSPFTNVTLAVGNQLYLHPTIAGYVTNVKPVAPNHMVYVGTVVNTGPSTPNGGAIVYRIQNGYELDELHDVLITSKVNGDVLQYESSTSLWKNKQIITTGFEVYSQVPVWTGTTAPSGTTSHWFRWTKVGNLVTLTLWLVYDINGTNTLSVTAPFPTGVPTPWRPPTVLNPSHTVNYGVGTIVPGRSSYSPAPGVCALVLASELPDTYALVAEREAGVNGQAVYLTISYFAA